MGQGHGLDARTPRHLPVPGLYCPGGGAPFRSWWEESRKEGVAVTEGPPEGGAGVVWEEQRQQDSAFMTCRNQGAPSNGFLIERPQPPRPSAFGTRKCTCGQLPAFPALL